MGIFYYIKIQVYLLRPFLERAAAVKYKATVNFLTYRLPLVCNVNVKLTGDAKIIAVLYQVCNVLLDKSKYRSHALKSRGS